MAEVIVTIKIMPSSPETNLEEIESKAREIIEGHGKFVKADILPIAFGLKQLNIVFTLDESKAEMLEAIENKLKEIEGINSVETIDVRRAIG